MAKEPQGRDEARRSDEPADDVVGAPPPRDAGRAKNDKQKLLPEDSFLLDVGEEAPRLRSAAEDDSAEEWILVEDDLLAAAEADAAKAAKSGAKMPVAELKGNDEAARLIEEMKDIGGDGTPVAPYDDGGNAANAAEGDPDAAGAVESEDSKHYQPDAASIVSPAVEPLAASARDSEREIVQPSARQAPARKAPRRMSRAAGLLIAASLVAAGGWFAMQHYGIKLLPTTEVASNPAGEKPTPPPAPKSAVKPTTKPAIEKPKPADPSPDLTAKKPPTPDPKATTTPPKPPKPATGETIPVIPVNATPDPALTAGPILPKKVVPDPKAKGAPTSIVDTKTPIRPARPLGNGATKTTATTKKSDTIVELKNGYTLRGRLKRVKDDQITLGVPGGEFTFALADVKVLDSSAPEYLSEADMPAASIIMKTGQRLRGKLLKANDDHVVLVVEKGQIVIDRALIREVSFTGRIHF